MGSSFPYIPHIVAVGDGVVRFDNGTTLALQDFPEELRSEGFFEALQKEHLAHLMDCEIRDVMR